MRKHRFIITMALICGSAMAQDHRIESNDKALDFYFKPFYKFTDGHSIVVNWRSGRLQSFKSLCGRRIISSRGTTARASDK